MRAISRHGMRGGGLKTLGALAIAPLLVLLTPAAVQAADLRQGDQVTVPESQTVEDDIYAAAGSVDVLGTIDGSLIATGGTITVSGTVARDLLVAGGTVNVPGDVGGSVRVSGGTVTIGGTVAEDLVAAGGTIDLSPASTIGRDLVVAGGTVTAAGSIARRVYAGVGTLIFRGPVGGDVRAQVTTLRLEDGADLGGNLVYASENQAVIASGAKVAGTIRRNPPNFAVQRTPAQVFLDGLVGWVRGLVGLFVLGLVLVLVFPRVSRRTTEMFTGSPWASLLVGLGLLVGVPIVAIIAFVIGLIVGGWWLALAALALYAIALAVGYVLSGYFVGSRGLDLAFHRQVHPLLALLAGLVALTLVGLIPYLGGLVTLAAVVFGSGALLMALIRGSGSAAPSPAPGT